MIYTNTFVSQDETEEETPLPQEEADESQEEALEEETDSDEKSDIDVESEGGEW